MTSVRRRPISSSWTAVDLGDREHEQRAQFGEEKARPPTTPARFQFRQRVRQRHRFLEGISGHSELLGSGVVAGGADPAHRAGQAVAREDELSGSKLGGFNWSSQHSDREVERWRW
jgi:hypothetical protein